MKRFLRENSLGLFFGALFLLALTGQAIAGHIAYNDGQAVMENWQSEYLQFLVFLLATIWVLQKGSPESKPLDESGRESDEEQMIGSPPSRTRRSGPGWGVGGRGSTATRC
jgi:hypothetical protein